MLTKPFPNSYLDVQIVSSRDFLSNTDTTWPSTMPLRWAGEAAHYRQPSSLEPAHVAYVQVNHCVSRRLSVDASALLLHGSDIRALDVGLRELAGPPRP